MEIIRRNAELGRPFDISSWRRIAIGAWGMAHDCSLYGFLDLDAGPALDYIETLSHSSGKHVTITHFLAKAVAEVLRRHPEINSVLRWGKIYPRKHTDVFVMVASDPIGIDLSGRNIRDADRKTVVQIAGEVESSAQSIRRDEDRSYRGMKTFYRWLPGIFSRVLMRSLEKILVALNLWSPLFGFPRDAFGSAMLSNVGFLGLDRALGALVPFSGSPLFITFGKIQEVPVIRDGKVEGRKQITLGVTTDHRIIDGVQAGRMAATLRAIFDDPWKQLD